jgi:uncharacterized protein (DUF1778 family)
MKLGRPRLSKHEKKNQITGIRLRTEEREIVERAALRQSQRLSDWIRETLLSKAQRQLSKD